MVQNITRSVEGFVNNRKVFIMCALDLWVSTLLLVIFFLFWYNYVGNPVAIWVAQDKGGVVENEGIENEISIISSFFEFIILITFYLHQTCKGHRYADMNQLTLTLLHYPMSLTSIISTSPLMNLMTLKSSTIRTSKSQRSHLKLHWSRSRQTGCLTLFIDLPVAQTHLHCRSQRGLLAMGNGFAVLYALIIVFIWCIS